MKWLFDFFRNESQEPEWILSYLGLTASDLCRHFFFCGETGSGKTSVIRILLEAYLWLECPGAMHCCVKADEAEWVCDLVRSTPMANRLIHLIPGEFTFNIAGFELTRVGGSPESLTRLLQRLNEQRNRSTGNDGEKSFWQNLFFDFMHYAITICWIAFGEKTTLEHIYKLITTSPVSPEQVASAEFQQSFFMTTLRHAESRVATQGAFRALDRAAEFFFKTQTTLGSKARGAGVQECCSILGPFMLSPFFETFCAEQSSFTPDMPLDQNYVVIDMPILVHGPAAELAQNLITTMTIDAALRQKHPSSTTLIVRDEFQMLAGNPLYETLAHSVARSHGLSFWSAVQNLPLLTSAFGGDTKAETNMKSLLANYATKFILANTCMDVTNRFFSTMLGQHKEHFHSFNEQQQQEPNDTMDAVLGTSRYSFGSSTQYADRVPPDHFMHLRRGGPPDFVVDAYMAGRIFSETGLPFKLVTFHQE